MYREALTYYGVHMYDNNCDLPRVPDEFIHDTVHMLAHNLKLGVYKKMY